MEQKQINKESLITFRFMNKNDEPFVYKTWLQGLKFGNSWYKLIEDKAYYSVYHKVIEAIILKKEVTVLVACLKEDSEVILGYSVFEPNRFHWVHIKKKWRGIGLARDLFPKDIKIVTHLTSVGKNILLKHNLVFNPFALV